jgi:putative salt-induced outer membrane protein
MTARIAVIGILVALVPATASAEWSGKGQFGGVLSRGNSDTETLNAKIDITNEIDRWKHKAGFSMLRTVNEDVTSADRWELRGQSEYALTERSFVFGSLRYEDDRFTDYDYQATAAAGYGYHLIATETTKLDGLIGVGFRRTELRLTGETEEEAILRGGMDFEHQLTATTQVYNKFLVESGSDNTFLQNQLGMEVKINDSFVLGVDYAVRHNTDVLPGTDETDQVLSVNLVYGF